MEEKIDLGPVYLRPITMDDTERIVGWRNSDRVRKNFIFQKPFTVQGHIEWMETKVASGEVVQFLSLIHISACLHSCLPLTAMRWEFCCLAPECGLYENINTVSCRELYVWYYAWEFIRRISAWHWAFW